MCDFSPPIRLIRYLLVLRVNNALVRMPRCLSVEMSLVLGSLIAERLPTHEARQWRKALAPWRGYIGEAVSVPGDPRLRGDQPQPPFGEIPDMSWPLDVVWHVYPGKLMYGQGEPILVELKLLGASAEHDLFLELILPVLEEAARIRDVRWQRGNKLWGHYDVDAIYAARGLRWEPLAVAGRLDLSYHATPLQWADGMPLTGEPGRQFKQLTWLSPFALSPPDEAGALWAHQPRHDRKRKEDHPQAPSLLSILEATEVRLRQLQLGRRGTGGIMTAPGPEGAPLPFAETTPTWPDLLEQAAAPAPKGAPLPSIQQQRLEPAPKDWPGDGIGWQRFDTIPAAAVPYLNLAAILHIGRYTHFGCGTFMLTE